MLYAFWPLDAHGRPDPESADAWGEPCPFDALDPYRGAAVGPFLTVVRDGALVYSGDVSHVLSAFAAEVARRSGAPLPTGSPCARALHALRTLADQATDDHAAEAVLDWRDPDPDTQRYGLLPEHVRRRVRHDAEAHGRAHASRALARRLAFLARPAHTQPARLAA